MREELGISISAGAGSSKLVAQVGELLEQVKARAGAEAKAKAKVKTTSKKKR